MRHASCRMHHEARRAMRALAPRGLHSPPRSEQGASCVAPVRAPLRAPAYERVHGVESAQCDAAKGARRARAYACRCVCQCALLCCACALSASCVSSCATSCSCSYSYSRSFLYSGSCSSDYGDARARTQAVLRARLALA
jgi:hypothetical protein